MLFIFSSVIITNKKPNVGKMWEKGKLFKVGTKNNLTFDKLEVKLNAKDVCNLWKEALKT